MEHSLFQYLERSEASKENRQRVSVRHFFLTNEEKLMKKSLNQEPYSRSVVLSNASQGVAF